MLLHYLVELKSSFSRYLADMDEKVNKLHFKFTAFNASKRVICMLSYELAEY